VLPRSSRPLGPGRRSPRKGQAGRIREGLQACTELASGTCRDGHVASRSLLHPVQTEWDANGGGIPLGFGSRQVAGRFTRTDTTIWRSAPARRSASTAHADRIRHLAVVFGSRAQATTPADATEAGLFFDRASSSSPGSRRAASGRTRHQTRSAPYSTRTTGVSGDTARRASTALRTRRSSATASRRASRSRTAARRRRVRPTAAAATHMTSNFAVIA